MHLSAYLSGECHHSLLRAFQGSAALAQAEVVADVGGRPTLLIQLEMERWEATAAKRSVWPMIQLVIKPP